MITEQFISSENKKESLALIRTYYIDECNFICKELGISDIIDFKQRPMVEHETLFPSGKLDIKLSGQYMTLLEYVEVINIIDEKLSS